jgi:hypothetical protein
MSTRLRVTPERNDSQVNVESDSKGNEEYGLEGIVHNDTHFQDAKDDDGSLDRIRLTLISAGFDHIPAYSVLRDAEDNGGAVGLRRTARVIREVHGGIYRTAAMLWARQPGFWEQFPADPIPRRVIRIRDGKVLCATKAICNCTSTRLFPPISTFT